MVPMFALAMRPFLQGWAREDLRCRAGAGTAQRSGKSRPKPEAARTGRRAAPGSDDCAVPPSWQIVTLLVGVTIRLLLALFPGTHLTARIIDLNPLLPALVQPDGEATWQ
jgi:hypothetical protein